MTPQRAVSASEEVVDAVGEEIAEETAKSSCVNRPSLDSGGSCLGDFYDSRSESFLIVSLLVR